MLLLESEEGGIMGRGIYEHLSLLCLILTCLIGIRRIHIDLNSFSKKYNKLTAEERKLYDSKKINRMGIIWLSSIVLITLLMFIFDAFLKKSSLMPIFIVCYVFDLIAYFLISNTKWVLDLFCKSKGGLS